MNGDSLLILTDFEPDDIIALALLFKNLPPNMCCGVIVGEGGCDKRDAVRALAAMYRAQVIIAEGRRSDKAYPVEMLEAIPSVHNMHALPYMTATNLIEYVLTTQKPTIVALKPAWELYGLPQEMLARATLYMYGSFNFRATFDEVAKNVVAHWLNTSFAHVYLYESYLATGSQSSVNAKNSPALFEALADKMPELTPVMTAWNTSIVLECADTVADRVAEARAAGDCLMKAVESIERNNKIILAILRGGVATQLVLADMALVAAMLTPAIPWTPIAPIVFSDGGYTMATATTQSTKLSAVLNVPFDAVVAAVTALVNRI
jgi:hypothetical protein